MSDGREAPVAPARTGPATGVVIVHGVGSQPQSETLRWFADPLVAWLRAWHRAHPSTSPGDAFRVESSHLSYGDALRPREPAHLELHLPPFDTWPAQDWIVAEAWWAARLEAPELKRMATWALGHFANFFSTLIYQTFVRLLVLIGRLVRKRKVGPVTLRYDEPGWFGALVEFASAVVLLLTYLAASVIVIPLIVVLYVLARIPIEAAQRFILVRLLTPLLVDNVGDFEVYVDDEVQALHVRHKVEETIDWLVRTRGCTHVIVIGHSQGTVVSFDALAGGHLLHKERTTKLITVGSPLNSAWSQAPGDERLQQETLEETYWLDIWSFYDFIHGGKDLERPNGIALASASDRLRWEMRWWENGPERLRVVNRMNVRTEHGGYWVNREQVMSRIAQEIDCPDRHHWKSRFFFTDEADRIERRRVRVTSLTLWRLAALGGFFGVVAVRFASGQSLAGIGRVARDLVSLVPGGAGVLQGLVAFLEWARGQLGDGIQPESWTLVLLALVVLAASFQSAHLFLTSVLYDPWDADEGEASVQPALGPADPWSVALRSAFVLALLGALAWYLAVAAPDGVIVMALLVTLAAILIP